MKNLICIVLACLAGHLSTAAEAQLFEVNVTLSAVTLDGRITDIKYVDGADVESLTVYRKQRSRSFTYRGDRTLTFFRELKLLDEEGSPVREVVAQVQLPGVSGRYLLLMSRHPSDSNQYNIMALPDNWSDFSVGTYRFLNLSSFEIALKLAGDVHRIKSQNYTDVKTEFTTLGHYDAIMVSLPQEHDPVKIFEGSMQYVPGIRMLYIISPRPGREGAVRFMGISDRMPEPQNQEE